MWNKSPSIICCSLPVTFVGYLNLPSFFCSADKGWLNPPLRFDDEPCRHKVLDLVGDLSLFAQFGNQGLPMAHIVAFKV